MPAQKYLDEKGNAVTYLNDDGMEIPSADTFVGPEDSVGPNVFVGPQQPEVGVLGKLKRNTDTVLLNRRNQLSGEESGILNPNPDQNPLLNKPFWEPIPRNVRYTHPEDFPEDNRGVVGKTIDSLYDTGASMINSLFSPLGIYGAAMGSNPADMSLESTGVGVTKPKFKAVNGKLELVEDPKIVNQTIKSVKAAEIKPEDFADIQGKLDSHLEGLKGKTVDVEVSKPNRLSSETGALTLRGFSSKETKNLRQQMVSAVQNNERIDTASMFESVKDKLSEKQFDKVINDIIDSGDLERAYNARPNPNTALDTAPMQSKPASFTDAVMNLKNAVSDHLNARATQDAMVTEEKALRAGKLSKIVGQGTEGFSQKSSTLKGEYPKVPIEPIKEAISQLDLDELMNAPEKVFTDQFQRYRAQSAIAKVFGLVDNKSPLQPSEIKLLQQTFGQEMGDQLAQLHGGIALVADVNPQFSKIRELGNLAKSLQASTDLSAPLRQGLPMLLRKEFYPSFVNMFKYGAKEANYAGLQDYLKTAWPDRELAQKSGLATSDIGIDAVKKEEHFLSSLPEKIPVLGPIFRGSERAYVGFINKLRADVFSSMIADLEKSGIATKTVMKLKNGSELVVPTREAKQVARYVNVATGRGSLGAAEKYGDLLNNVFYSPRFQASRIQLVTDPIRQWSTLNPVVRKEYLKSLLAVGGFVTTANALGQALGGKLTANSTSSDFGKVGFGKTRLDTGAGFLQYLVLASQLATGTKTNPVTGKSATLGEGYKADTRGDVLAKFARNKLAPIPSYAWSAFTGKNAIGQDFDPNSETAKLVIPLLAQDISDLIKEDPSLAGLIVPAVFGAGISTFEEFKKKDKSKTKSSWSLPLLPGKSN